MSWKGVRDDGARGHPLWSGARAVCAWTISPPLEGVPIIEVEVARRGFLWKHRDRHGGGDSKEPDRGDGGVRWGGGDVGG